MRPGARTALDVPRLLGRQRLLEREVLAVVPARLSRGVLASLPRGAAVAEPDEVPRHRRAYRTLIDLALAGLPAPRRALHLRALEDAVQPDGFLHVVGGHDPGGGLDPPGLLALVRCGWTLLTLQDGDGDGAGDGDGGGLAGAGPGPLLSGACGAWVASFVRVPPRRRPGRPAVRHFTDLGAFGSLDLGRPTDPADQPPWGT